MTMADQSRRLVKLVADQIKKHRFINNASATIGTATERAQEKFSNLQRVANEKYNTIVKQVNGTTIVQDLSAPALQPAQPLPERLVHWWRWYQQLTGLDMVDVAKQQVITVQDKLFKCQEERRNLHKQGAVINERLKEIYAELLQIKRDDPKYVQLTILENKGLQEQSRIASQLNLLENEEKDLFTELATAIKEYHDTQTMNTQKYKYLSILASALLAIISLTASMIYNNKRISDTRNVVLKAQRDNENILNAKFSELFARLDEKDKKSQIIENFMNTYEEMKIPNKTTQAYKTTQEKLQFWILAVGSGTLAMYILSKIIS